jgi:N-methylhydantoinase A
MRVAVDTGGTFTDVLIENDDGSVRMAKAATTPGRPLDGVRSALETAAADVGMSVRQLLGRTRMFIYGTTHALNAVVTGRTATTAFLTTAGHPDILVLREGGRPDPFDYSMSTPAPYIPRALTWEVPERVLADGSVAVPLDETEVRRIAQELRAARIEAVAVCFLWASLNPAHEQRVARLLCELLPGIQVSLSSHVSPTIREYRRASATAIDASLKPSMKEHLNGLSAFLKQAGLAGELLVVTSQGGVLDVDTAADMPIQMLKSGPAMAPVAGRHFAQVDESSDFAIVADTGGTTYDVSVVRRGRIPMTRETRVDSPTGSHITGFASIDIKSIGAGGGSIAWVDAGGMLHVGPQSAGAEPGPAAYGKGGTGATLTDACLALGYLDPDFFLGGRRKLDLGAALAAIERTVAARLGRGVEEAAMAIVDIATENMVQAIEAITVNQGVDPQGAVLIGGGGAAGLNSVWIARRLGVKRLLIPEMGPALSACGALMSDLTAQYRRTFFARSDRFNVQAANQVLAALFADCKRFLASAALEGNIELSVEARYPDQVWEIEVPLGTNRFDTSADVRALEAAFHRSHEELFSIRDDKSPVEVVNWCATVSAKVRDHANLRMIETDAPWRGAVCRSRQVYFPETGVVSAVVHRFGALQSGATVQGPAMVESPFTTVVLPPRSRATRTAAGSLSIDAISEETT